MLRVPVRFIEPHGIEHFPLADDGADGISVIKKRVDEFCKSDRAKCEDLVRMTRVEAPCPEPHEPIDDVVTEVDDRIDNCPDLFVGIGVTAEGLRTDEIGFARVGAMGFPERFRQEPRVD